MACLQNQAAPADPVLTQNPANLQNISLICSLTAEKIEQAQERPDELASGGAGAAACPEDDAPVYPVEKSTKNRNRNPAKWELLQEWVLHNMRAIKFKGSCLR